jgi:hypothetical protein
MATQANETVSVTAILEQIAEAHDGILRATDVVDAARPEGSPLHSQFDWNDDEAADKWRLEQARRLIRVCVTTIPHGENEYRVRAFVSLAPDRQGEGGGYRRITAVVAERGMRAQLLEDALAELQSFEEKYRSLKELADVFAAARKVRRTT